MVIRGMLEGYWLRNVGGLYLDDRCGMDRFTLEVESAALSNGLDNSQASGLSKRFAGNIVLKMGKLRTLSLSVCEAAKKRIRNVCLGFKEIFPRDVNLGVVSIKMITLFYLNQLALSGSWQEQKGEPVKKTEASKVGENQEVVVCKSLKISEEEVVNYVECH